jgi:hypothetical protein
MTGKDSAKPNAARVMTMCIFGKWIVTGLHASQGTNPYPKPI